MNTKPLSTPRRRCFQCWMRKKARVTNGTGRSDTRRNLACRSRYGAESAPCRRAERGVSGSRAGAGYLRSPYDQLAADPIRSGARGERIRPRSVRCPKHRFHAAGTIHSPAAPAKRKSSRTSRTFKLRTSGPVCNTRPPRPITPCCKPREVHC